ncbi:MAG: apiosidase-like domain-containing protein [Limisphaerales bacterium]
MRAADPVYPVKVSENGRYFIDQKGEPVFWLGTTLWQLFRDYTLDEARIIIERTREKGFAFAQVMLMGVGDGTKTNVYGDKPWLDFDSMQTWKSVDLIYPMVTKDYNLKPVKPVLMAEGAYEHGSEYGFEVTPLWIRRQAYYSYLAGAHHTYGHNDSWRVLPTWKQALDAPGAAQLGVLKKIFMDRKEWRSLVPDQSIFAAGGNTNGQVLNLAARHKDARWLMVYLGGKASISINMSKLVGKAAKAFWIDPKTGRSVAIGDFPTAGVEAFSTPADWQDALLILEASDG